MSNLSRRSVMLTGAAASLAAGTLAAEAIPAVAAEPTPVQIFDPVRTIAEIEAIDDYGLRLDLLQGFSQLLRSLFNMMLIYDHWRR